MQRELAMNTQVLLIDISAYTCILKHSSNVVAQLTKMCRPVGCCPVRLYPSRLSISWFVAQMTVYGEGNHRSGVTDNSGITAYGLTALGREMSTPLRSSGVWQV